MGRESAFPARGERRAAARGAGGGAGGGTGGGGAQGAVDGARGAVGVFARRKNDTALGGIPTFR